MSIVIPETVVPLDHVYKMLTAKHLTRTEYLEIRRRWFGWLTDTGQQRKPMKLSPSEELSMDFIDYQLSAEEKDACVVWMETLGNDYRECPNEVVHAGYRITFTHDEKHDCVVVTLIGRATDCPNYNKAMTTRHVDIATALMMALYKQIVVFEYASWGSTNTESMFG